MGVTMKLTCRAAKVYGSLVPCDLARRIQRFLLLCNNSDSVISEARFVAPLGIWDLPDSVVPVNNTLYVLPARTQKKRKKHK